MAYVMLENQPATAHNAAAALDAYHSSAAVLHKLSEIYDTKTLLKMLNDIGVQMWNRTHLKK